MTFNLANALHKILIDLIINLKNNRLKVSNLNLKINKNILHLLNEIFYKFNYLQFMKKVLLPIPKIDFDPSETAIPWKTLTDSNISVVFSTPNGSPGTCDEKMLHGKGLGPFSKILTANKNVKTTYEKMISSSVGSMDSYIPMGWQLLPHLSSNG